MKVLIWQYQLLWKLLPISLISLEYWKPIRWKKSGFGTRKDVSVNSAENSARNTNQFFAIEVWSDKSLFFEKLKDDIDYFGSLIEERGQKKSLVVILSDKERDLSVVKESAELTRGLKNLYVKIIFSEPRRAESRGRASNLAYFSVT